jgi:hypothetical protein
MSRSSKPAPGDVIAGKPAQGIDLYAVFEVLRHSSVAITKDVWACPVTTPFHAARTARGSTSSFHKSISKAPSR